MSAGGVRTREQGDEGLRGIREEEEMDQYGVYLPVVSFTVWIRQRRSEQEKKQGELGRRGGGITDNILFNDCLNKNIVFFKKKENQVS